MTKKSFASGLDRLIQSSQNQSDSKESSRERIEKQSTNALMTKATYYYDSNLLQKMKSIAYYDRKTIGEVMNEALSNYLTGYTEIERAQASYKKRTKK